MFVITVHRQEIPACTWLDHR